MKKYFNIYLFYLLNKTYYNSLIYKIKDNKNNNYRNIIFKEKLLIFFYSIIIAPIITPINIPFDIYKYIKNKKEIIKYLNNLFKNKLFK
jgi:hypothetical protein